jgi:predicted enzyme related to lactoylglutathione lyase
MSDAGGLGQGVSSADRSFVMARPVAHLEVIGRDPDQLRHYYGDLFGWTFETPSPVAKEVSDAECYGSACLG